MSATPTTIQETVLSVMARGEMNCEVSQCELCTFAFLNLPMVSRTRRGTVYAADWCTSCGLLPVSQFGHPDRKTCAECMAQYDARDTLGSVMSRVQRPPKAFADLWERIKKTPGCLVQRELHKLADDVRHQRCTETEGTVELCYLLQCTVDTDTGEVYIDPRESLWLNEATAGMLICCNVEGWETFLDIVDALRVDDKLRYNETLRGFVMRHQERIKKKIFFPDPMLSNQE